jgi:CRISPR type III-B/RAMP module-associated protein Cmr3
MQLRGPFLAQRQANNSIMPYFPLPADILHLDSHRPGQEPKRRLIPLKPAGQSAFVTNWPQAAPTLQPCLYDDALVEAGDKAEGGQFWISAHGLQAYLNGTITTDDYIPPEGADKKQWLAEKEAELDKAGKLGRVHLRAANHFFSHEHRLGIGIDGAHKRPSDGKLYTANFIRPCQDVGLLVEVTGLGEDKWPPTGILSLGGERKSARYTIIKQPAHWPASAPAGRKLYLATPTRFEGGWQAGDKWQTYFADAGQLTAACIGHPQMIGGWDMAQNRPKPMQRYVPAGSVYFFTGKLHQTEAANPICDDSDAGQIGFGTTFIGR